MDATAFMALAAICAPLVSPSTAQAIVWTESAFNPFAIGIVRGRLTRQPRRLEDAVKTASALRDLDRNFSVGLAQINIHSLRRFEMSLEDGFDVCKNLQAMQSVLLECYERTDGRRDDQLAVRRALSCYYSGNFTTGFRDGYVDRVVHNARRVARAPP